jgi:hypothetical protein
MLGMLCQVKLVKNMQVEQLCLLEAAYRAVEDAGIPLEQLRSTATGIFAAAYTPFMVSWRNIILSDSGKSLISLDYSLAP